MSEITKKAPDPLPPEMAIGLVIASWLIPGLGFWVMKRRGRAACQFLIVMLTFVMGLVLRGGVVWPMGVGEFNLINYFTFAVQVGAGLPALISLGANIGGFELLGGQLWHPFYELGSYYLIVAGAMNYFAVCNFYDRLVHTHPRFRKQEGLEPAAAKGADS